MRGEAEGSVCSGKFNESVKQGKKAIKKTVIWALEENIDLYMGEGDSFMHTYTANISRVCLGEISAFQMANLPSRDAYREVGAQRNPACPCVSLTSHRKRLFFFFFLLIAQSVSMRLMLYVRFYTNWHIRKKGSTFTFPHKSIFLLLQHSTAVRVFF